MERFRAGLIAAASVSVMLGVVAAQTGQVPATPGGAPTTDAAFNETPELWFVELNGAPTADGSSLAAVRAEKAAFRSAAAQARVSFVERQAYDTLWNGLSVRVAASQVGALSRIAGVKAIYPVVTVTADQSQGTDELDLATALAQTGADYAQNTLGLTGRGVKVAVMDTGIDYDHPDLGGCFGPGCRVAKGWDFVGDAFNADPSSPSYNPIALPDPYPDDCNGHGTHVAGIVGANGVIKGVAPGVTFHAYRVFGCEGSTTADIMLAAMERTLADGADVLNMSIGSAFQWPQYPTAQGADRLVNKGVSVVASIGNSGASGLYSASAPGLGKKVIGVASFDNTHVALPTFTISPDGTSIGYANATGAPAAPTSGQFPMARTGTSTSTADACVALPAASLSGKVALIRRGTCAFHIKSLNAMNAGAAAVVIYNNAAGRLSATVVGTPAITIPVVTISDTEGVLINSRLAAGPVDMTWTNVTRSFANPTGNLISSFSSYGLAPDLSMKPDIGAPGGLIRSTVPLEQGGYATFSGTSMASPHTAGAVALLLQARPHTSSNAVRSILQNSADPRVWWGNPGLGFLDNVHRQGAGMLDIPGAILATTKIEPGSLALGESESGPATRTLVVENKGAADVTYNLGHVAALATGANTFAPSFSLAPATVGFSTSPLTVPAGGAVSVDVSITAPASPNKGLYGGYIVFTPQGAGPVYRVPYGGFIGDYQSIQVLAPTANAFPWLAKLSGPSFFNQPSGATYTLVGDDVPFILAHFDHQSRLVRATIKEAGTGKNWHRAFDIDYFARNSAATSFFAFSWDGITTGGKKVYTVPNGQYVIELTVLKALGDDSNPAHWETWTSPVVTIARP